MTLCITLIWSCQHRPWGIEAALCLRTWGYLGYWLSSQGDPSQLKHIGGTPQPSSTYTFMRFDDLCKQKVAALCTSQFSLGCGDLEKYPRKTKEPSNLHCQLNYISLGRFSEVRILNCHTLLKLQSSRNVANSAWFAVMIIDSWSIFCRSTTPCLARRCLRWGLQM